MLFVMNVCAQGTLFVIRSSIKLLAMNYGCALSDVLGRRSVVAAFIIPNIVMDIMLIVGPINPTIVYVMGVLWGLNSISIPTLRAWVTDLTPDHDEVISALGAFRGFSIGLSTMVGIPLGAAIAAVADLRIAFALSLGANILGLGIVMLTSLEDVRSVAMKNLNVNRAKSSIDPELDVEFQSSNLFSLAFWIKYESTVCCTSSLNTCM
jgi:predicted MFS family arabinose efflux permease